MATVPFRAQAAGIPYQETETLGGIYPALLAGDTPPVVTQDKIAAASTAFKDLEVVGFNSSGVLVPAVYDATYAENGVRPIGIAVAAITTASASTTGIPIYREGCFNIDAIEWPASFDTDAKKFAAFEGAPSPTNIVLRRVKQATV